MAQPLYLLAPTPDRIAEVERSLALPAGMLQHALDQNELPRLEKDGTSTLVILRVPVVNTRPDEPPFGTVAVGLLFKEDAQVLVCRQVLPIVEALQRHAPAGPERAGHLLLRLVMASAEAFLTHLGTLTKEVDALEDRVGRALGNQEVLGLLRQQKSLVFFITALKENEILMERLRREPLLDVDAGDHDLLEDALVELRQALEVTRINSDILSSTMDAFASIISNNLNVVMKFLTAVTIVISIPTLVASLYGMNVPLPGAGTPGAFVVVSAVSLAVAGAVALLFWKKGWL
jgi:magnesium transporter